MKKILSTMLIMTSLVCFVSCSNDVEEIYIPQEVEFTLEYTFIESGSMTRASATRATGEEVYDMFYKKYIKNKILTPKNYYIEFKNKNDIVVLTTKGKWGENNGIRLPEGEYTVTGYSYPVEKYADKPIHLPSDTVYIKFDEKVNIIKDMRLLTLNAKYDSYLLLFDKVNKSKIEVSEVQKMLNNDESCYWLFSKEDSWTNWDNGFSFQHSLTANIYMDNGDHLEVAFGKLPLVIGKYYYFNDMTNSFDIPKMESGN